jgi:biopolymer transport protein ExbD
VIGGFGRSARADLVTGVNVTPLVDVMLVLLVIFIVTASFVVNPSIPLELPRAASASETPPDVLALVVTRDGTLYVDGRPAQVTELPAAVAAARARLGGGRTLTAFVSADVQAPYGRFAEVVDRLRVEGVTDIALDTRPAAEVPAR